MRRALVFALLCVATNTALAQQRHATSRGSALVGGTADFRRTTSDVEDSEAATTVVLAPSVMYLVRDRLAIGGEVSLLRASSGGRSTSGRAIGPAVRVFPGRPGARAQPFLEGSVLLGKNTFDLGGSSSSGQAKVEQTTRQFGAAAGLLFMMTRQVGLSSELFWERITEEGTSATRFEATQTNLGLRFGVAAFLIR